MTALDVSGLTVRFGGLIALQDVSLLVGAGEIVGLIGPNGAGKTTLIDAVTGFVGYEGSVAVSGESVDGLRPDQRVGRGVGRTFQSLELFEDLTVGENVSVDPRASTASVASALAATGLAAIADRLPATLAPSQRRFVALARAISAQPGVLLLDEIAAGLDRDERATMTGCVGNVVAAGSSALVVDHDLGFVSELCQRVVVLDAGRVIADGSPGDVRRDEVVLGAYLGRR